MPAVTFYKTKMNYSNRAYNSAALTNILSAAEKYTINVSPAVLPDTPFAVVSADNSITASDLILGGYDYIAFNYGNKTWYAFIDDIQPIAASQGNFFVSHTTDKWAMCCEYFTGENGSFHMQGYVERAHINDLVKSGNNVVIDMTNTTASTEAPYNKELLTVNTLKPVDIDIENMPDDISFGGFLYLYIANPNEIGISQDYQSYSYDNVNFFSSYGLLACYPIIINNSTGKVYFVASNTVATYNLTVDILELNEITSSAVTAMTISKLPPFDNLKTENGNSYGLSVYNTESDGSGQNYLFWNTDILKDLVVTFPNPNTGIPNINFFFNIKSININNFYNLNNYYLQSVNQYTSYSDYVQNIPKAISTIYNPIYINKNILKTQTEYTQIGDIYISLSPDIQNYNICFSQNNNNASILQFLGAETVMIVPNTAIFSSDIVIDYWTRLNATQMSLQASQQTFNAILNATVGTAYSSAGIGQNISSGNITGAIAQSKNVLSNIGNAPFSIMQAGNMQEIAEKQYNCGETRAFNTTGLYSAINDKSYSFITVYQIDSKELLNIGINLHRYGYSTFLQIDEIYENHMREAFNYFKGANVSVSGLPQSWCNDIAQMFNEGVTLWQNEVENYERTNYQIGIWDNS